MTSESHPRVGTKLTSGSRNQALCDEASKTYNFGAKLVVDYFGSTDGIVQYTLINPMKDLKVVASVFAVFALVWEVLFSFGLAFGFRQHESFFAWAFVIFTALLNIPAILCSWRWPRFSAYWLAFNTACSVVIALGTVLKKYSVLRHAADQIPLRDQFSGRLFGGFLWEAAAFWLVQMLLCALLLLSSRKTDDI